MRTFLETALGTVETVVGTVVETVVDYIRTVICLLKGLDSEGLTQNRNGSYVIYNGFYNGSYNGFYSSQDSFYKPGILLI